MVGIGFKCLTGLGQGMINWVGNVYKDVKKTNTVISFYIQAKPKVSQSQ